MNPVDPTPQGKCPFNHGATPSPLAGANDMPDRIKRLPTMRGFPVPFFVGTTPQGERDFRIADSRKLRDCIRHHLCWVCGEKLGRFKSFVIGPMCGITRTSAEPPSHYECAQYSVKYCPFLSRPNMKRRDHEGLKEMGTTAAGEMIERNPGVSAIWTTMEFSLFDDGRGGILFEVGEPIPGGVEWWREGRLATRDEVMASIDSGIPALRAMCDREVGDARAASHAELDAMRARLENYIPWIETEIPAPNYPTNNDQTSEQ